MSCHFFPSFFFFERSIQKLSVSCFQSFLIVLSHCHYYPVLGLYLVLFTLLVPFIQPVPFLLYLVLFTLTLLFALFTCGRHVFDLYYQTYRLYSFSFVSFTYVPLKSKTNYQNQLSTIVCYGDISSATICFFGLCLCVLCTRRVVLIDSKSCLEACLQAGFSGNLYKEQRLLKHSKGFVGFCFF